MLLENICPADGEPCEVAPSIEPDHLPLLPCMRCRLMEACADDLRRGQSTNLRSKSLGWNERWILGAAASPERVAARMPFKQPGWSLQPVPLRLHASGMQGQASRAELARQAARRLRHAGLIFSRRLWRGPQQLWRTPLGQQITAVYPQRGRIRWDRRLDEARAAARLPTPQLRRIFETKVEMLAEMEDTPLSQQVLSELDPMVVRRFWRV